jgi:hypothetical protein
MGHQLLKATTSARRSAEKAPHELQQQRRADDANDACLTHGELEDFAKSLVGDLNKVTFTKVKPCCARAILEIRLSMEEEFESKVEQRVKETLAKHLQILEAKALEDLSRIDRIATEEMIRALKRRYLDSPEIRSAPRIASEQGEKREREIRETSHPHWMERWPTRDVFWSADFLGTCHENDLDSQFADTSYPVGPISMAGYGCAGSTAHESTIGRSSSVDHYAEAADQGDNPIEETLRDHSDDHSHDHSAGDSDSSSRNQGDQPSQAPAVQPKDHCSHISNPPGTTQNPISEHPQVLPRIPFPNTPN